MQAENDDDLHGGQRSSAVKWGKLCAMATIFGQKKPWCKLRMMMTFIEVRGHQRSNGVNYVLWATIFGQKKHWCKLDDLYGGQRSSEVKWGKLCAMVTIFGQKKRWCKLRMMMTFIEVRGYQRSNGVNYVLWLPYFVKRSADARWEWWYIHTYIHI